MAWIVAGCVVARSLTLAVEWIRLRSGDGDTYSKRDFFTSDLARAVRAIPQGCVVFSDAPDAVWFLSRNSAQRLPARWSPFSRQANLRFEDELRAIGSLAARQPVRVVYFDLLKRTWMADREDLRAVGTVHLQLQTSLGAVYELAARD